MAPVLCLRTVLNTRFARALAAVIIVLAITPFTAPFSSFNPVEIVSEQVLHAGTSAKAAQDTTDLDALALGEALFTRPIVLDAVRLSELSVAGPISVVVLRI